MIVQHDHHDLIIALGRIASSVEVKPCHWISTPDGDLGSEWCPDCGRAMVRHLRRGDKKRRKYYILDGGWRTEHDYTVACAACGCRLDGDLTDHGAIEELDYFRDLDPAKANADDAYDLSDVLLTLQCTSQENARFALEAGTIARAIIDAPATP